jgi:hypothetical protein
MERNLPPLETEQVFKEALRRVNMVRKLDPEENPVIKVGGLGELLTSLTPERAGPCRGKMHGVGSKSRENKW